MYLELCETTIKSGTQISKEYPGKAYLLTNVSQPVKDGITLEPHGALYAVADKEGLDKLCKTSSHLEHSGVHTLVDTLALFDAMETFIDFL